MKKREISRVFTDRTPERPSEIGTSRSHITNDPIIPMEMDEMEISYDSEDEQYDSRDKQKFNFLAKKTSKSKRKFNIDPFVLIEHLLSDCPTCCKLYSVNKLPTDKPSHCSFQNFPNHPMANYRSLCGAVITKQVPTNQGIIYRPALILPILNIICQLARFYHNKGFEELCMKWETRP